jgi:drug/metabolite transporter (DMT)-like permease
MILGSMVLRENYLLNKRNLILYKKTSVRSWIYLLIASLIGTSLGAYLYTESVHLAGANVVSLIATASPLFALPLTYAVNKETISKYGFIGVVLTILGVIIILL